MAQADQDRNNAYSQAQALEEQAQELETWGSQLESQGDSEGAGAQYTQAEDLRQQAQALRQEADQAYEAALSRSRQSMTLQSPRPRNTVSGRGCP